MSALTPVLPRIGSLIRMFASGSDGEALGAVRALGRTLESRGASFHDLADRIEHEPAPVTIYVDRPAPRPPRPNRRASASSSWTPDGIAATCAVLRRALAAGILSDFETEFASSINASSRSSRLWRPSLKQAAIIERIVAKTQRAGCC